MLVERGAHFTASTVTSSQGRRRAAEAAEILRECGGAPQGGVRSRDEVTADNLADSLANQRKIYGAMHENTLDAAAALADWLEQIGRVEEAESLYLEYGLDEYLE